MNWTRLTVVVVLLLGGMRGLAAAPNGLLGEWMTPGGSVLKVGECGTALCITVIKLGPTAKGTTDHLNPDPALKERPVCGMKIGEAFIPDGPNAARGGTIYDPESGKTYSAKIARDGERLKLRGFVGVSLFGRTEIWTRTTAIEPCKPA